MIKEATLYQKLMEGRVRCLVCERQCVIPEGERGYCLTRENRGGKLYSLIYGEVSTFFPAPMEIKPLYHFYPGSRALSFGSLGCNFRCIHCQNWEIAHTAPGRSSRETEYITPEKAVELAISSGCEGICWTYNEPAIWLEYILDTAKLAKERGLHTSIVTNGYLTVEALDLIGPYIDAFRVDIKGFSNEFYQKIANVPNFFPVLRTVIRAKKKWGMHIEVVTNVIPTLNDNDREAEGIAEWIVKSLGKDTPWHITRFIPHYKLEHLPETPVSTLERFHNIGKKVGLSYIYIGNVPNHPLENTYCPKCGSQVITRRGHRLISHSISEGKCAVCGAPIPIIGGVNGPFKS